MFIKFKVYLFLSDTIYIYIYIYIYTHTYIYVWVCERVCVCITGFKAPVTRLMSPLSRNRSTGLSNKPHEKARSRTRLSEVIDFRHTCPDPHLGSWNCLPHQAHIALSEPMSSTDKQGSSLCSFPTSPPLYPHFNRPSGFWPCVKSCLVGGSNKYRL